MTNNIERRFDDFTAKQIPLALDLAAQFGYERARKFLLDAGVPDALVRQILMIRYDRRPSILPEM